MIALARHPLAFTSLALALLSAACGSSVETHGTGGNGGSTSTSCPPYAPPCCTPGQPDPCCIVCSSTTSTSGGGFGGTGGGGAFCGGFAGTQCPPDQYCDYPDNLCGAIDGGGVCTPKPQGCPDIYQPTCGCDGTVHASACDAANNGYDQNDLGGCAAPSGMFACGSHFCQQGSDYCEMYTSDVGSTPSTFTCKPLPAACGGLPSCACLANQPCGFACAPSSDGGGFELTCGGG